MVLLGRKFVPKKIFRNSLHTDNCQFHLVFCCCLLEKFFLYVVLDPSKYVHICNNLKSIFRFMFMQRADLKWGAFSLHRCIQAACHETLGGLFVLLLAPYRSRQELQWIRHPEKILVTGYIPASSYQGIDLLM